MDLQACHKGMRTKRMAHQRHRAFPMTVQAATPRLLSGRKLEARSRASVLKKANKELRIQAPCLWARMSHFP